VDTGATLLVVPAPLAQRLQLVARRTQAVVIAGGQRASWPSGPALLGAVALESLFLAVDPVAKRLVPVEGFALAGTPR